MFQGRLKYLIFVWLFASTMTMYAQNEEKGARRIQAMRESNPVNQKLLENRSRVDTLTLLDRIAVRTNTVDWMLLIPSIGAEFDVKPVNWNRWTVGFNVRGNPQTSHTFTHGVVFNMFEARVEARQYWRARQINRAPNARLKDQPHKHIWDKAISIRRSRVKHPMFTWYRGLYAGYGKYSFLFGSQGHQGTAIVGGVSYGFVVPMFGLPSGNTIDLEFGICGGVVYYKDDVYIHDRESDCYPIIESKPAAILPMIDDIRVGLVYRLGRAPVLSKYRYRRDVDVAYDDRLTALHDRRVFLRDSAKNYRRDYDEIFGKFWHVYDSIAAADNARKTININDLKMPDDEADDAKKQKKSKERLDKSLKKLQKAEAKEAKEAKKSKDSNEAQKPQKPKKEKKSKKATVPNDSVAGPSEAYYRGTVPYMFGKEVAS